MSKTTFIKLSLFLVLIILMGMVAFHPAFTSYRHPRAWLGWIHQMHGSGWAAFLYVLIYIMSVVLAFPGSVLTLVGGAAFGFVQGSGLVIIASNGGAVLAFLLGRYLGHNILRRWLIQHQKLQSTLAQAHTHGFQTILMLRLVPLFPFNVINYAAGASGFHLRDYVLGSFMGMLPGTLVYVYFADSVMAGLQGAQASAFKHMVISSGLLVLLSLLPMWIKRRKRLSEPSHFSE